MWQEEGVNHQKNIVMSKLSGLSQEGFEFLKKKSDGVEQTDAEVVINGRVNMACRIWGTLVIGPEGVLEGSIRADRVLVYGTVEGDLSADEYLYAASSSKIFGRITAAHMRIEEGTVCRFKAALGEVEKQHDDRDLSELVALREVINQKKYLRLLMKSPVSDRPKPANMSP